MDRRKFLKGAAAMVAMGGSSFFNQALAKTAPLGPYLAPWTGEHGGVPPFDKLKTSEVKAALLQGMDLKRLELETLTSNKEAPSFKNTIASLEGCGRPLDRAIRFFDIFTSSMNDKTMQAIESEITPILQKFDDEVIQNQALFDRIKTVYEKLDQEKLNAEQERLTEVIYKHFARKGAGLDSKKKERLAKINEKLATLYTDFRHNQLADEEDHCLVIEDEADLDGLSDDLRKAAAAQAESSKLTGKWVITNTRSSMEPFLSFSSRRDLREKGWRIWTKRGDNNDKHDNKKIISEILKLRAERAQLLGFPTHAHWSLDNNMAKTPEAALDLMKRVWKASIARACEEVADMQAIADKEDAKITIEPWDYRYYAEKVRKEKYDLDQNEVKEYLQLDKILEGMFFAANQVFGLEMVKLEGLPVIHPDITVYEVRRDGKQVGLWYFDPYARDGKHSGAWMNEYRTQEKYDEPILPIVSNNANFVKGKAGEPTLISCDDATTL
ncbi:MAG: twin-arginine translocation signal domain-containing protein, partial [Candidatus Obscuribacterales bacterium]|nr:twin-arginine translocation signal domain-containing protein [Candidatus Obscuribacterales bacterium]